MRAKTERVLLLGGTQEAVTLAADLVAQGFDVITSLAGRTREPNPVAGRLRVGGFGGAEGLAAYLQAEGVARVIDATHPFASTISANAKAACEKVGASYERHERPEWKPVEGDDWQIVSNIPAAVSAIPEGARVLLALGRQHIDPFAVRADCHFLIRMIEEPETPLPFADHTLLLARPSRDWRDEAALLREHRITHVVSRNSGGPGAYAKIEAARHLGLPVIMIERPKAP